MELFKFEINKIFQILYVIFLFPNYVGLLTVFRVKRKVTGNGRVL